MWLGPTNNSEHVDYLKQFEPTGTRDTGTRDFLRSIGVKAETTYCLTLTFALHGNRPRGMALSTS